MFRTSLRVYPIQVSRECLDSNGEVYSDLDYSVEETVAWLNGQGASREEVMSGYETFGCNFGNADCPILKTLPELPVDDLFTIHTSDGGKVVEALASLTRRFQLIRDYVSDFPDERSITIPYTTDIVENVVKIDVSRTVLLTEVYECICHLNPISATYYFYFDTEGTSPERLKEIASLCTDEEKSSIIDAARIDSGCILPSNGLGFNFLAAVLYRYLDIQNAKLLFSDYPSFITLMLIHTSIPLLPYMMSADYSKKLEFNIGDSDTPALVRKMFSTINTREEAVYVLSVMKKYSKINTPYRWDLRESMLIVDGRHSLPTDEMARLLGMDESAVRDQLGLRRL